MRLQFVWALRRQTRRLLPRQKSARCHFRWSLRRRQLTPMHSSHRLLSGRFPKIVPVVRDICTSNLEHLQASLETFHWSEIWRHRIFLLTPSWNEKRRTEHRRFPRSKRKVQVLCKPRFLGGGSSRYLRADATKRHTGHGLNVAVLRTWTSQQISLTWKSDFGFVLFCINEPGPAHLVFQPNVTQT